MKKLKLAILSAASVLMLAPTTFAKTSGVIVLDRSGSMSTNRTDGQTRCKYSKHVALSEVDKFFKYGGDEIKIKGFGTAGRLTDYTNGFVNKSDALAAVNSLGDEACDLGSTALAEAMCLSADELRGRAAGGDKLRVIGFTDGDENDSPTENCGNPDWQAKVTSKFVSTTPQVSFDTVIFDDGGNVAAFAAPTALEPAATRTTAMTTAMTTAQYLIWLSTETGGTATYHYDDNTTSVVSSGFSIKSKQGSYTDNQMDVELELWNNSDSTMSLKDTTIRYYFNNGSGHKYSGSIWYYDISGTRPKISCSGVSSSEADYFCDIVFDRNAPTLAANKAVSIEAVFYGQPKRYEYSGNDYSNPENKTSFTTNNKIVVYKNNKKVWGQEPVAGGSPVTIESYDARTYNFTVEPVIFLKRQPNTTIDLSQLKIRYYMYSTLGAASGYTGDMWFDDAPGATTPTVSCHDMVAPVHNRTDMANMYCEVSFADGYLNSSDNELQVDFAAWYGSWGGSYESQYADWSWNGTSRASNERIVVIYKDEIVWGDVPR